MSERWLETTLGEVARQVRRATPVVEGVDYPLLGMRWYGGGSFVREVAVGGKVKATRFFRVEPGDFIYNRLFAWKGAFGVIPDDQGGAYVSGEFPLFETDGSRLIPEYLNLLMCRPAGMVPD